MNLLEPPRICISRSHLVCLLLAPNAQEFLAFFIVSTARLPCLKSRSSGMFARTPWVRCQLHPALSFSATRLKPRSSGQPPCSSPAARCFWAAFVFVVPWHTDWPLHFASMFCWPRLVRSWLVRTSHSLPLTTTFFLKSRSSGCVSLFRGQFVIQRAPCIGSR